MCSEGRIGPSWLPRAWCRWPVTEAAVGSDRVVMVSPAFEELGQPQGYKLVARVVNYPDDMIGDIGLYVTWKD